MAANRVRFPRADNNKRNIYLIGLTGGEARKLTDMRQAQTDRSWSPRERIVPLASNVAERRDEDRGIARHRPDDWHQ